MANTNTTNFIGSTTPRRSFYFSACMSPSCVPVDEQYTRIKSTRSDNHHHQRRKLKKLMNKVVEESKKSIYGSSKPLVFHYDAVSYSQNFDEGNHGDDFYMYRLRIAQVLGECS
ncbi:hypothetical protein Lser_V15G19880 [Lactuca serriola]